MNDSSCVFNCLRYIFLTCFNFSIPQPRFSINDVSAVESDGTMTFTVTRSGDMSVAVQVDVAVTPGTTTDGVDYVVGGLPGSLSFLANEATQTIELTIIDDIVVEGNEDFTVTLSNPTNGAIIEDCEGIGTIVDNDGVSQCQSS